MSADPALALVVAYLHLNGYFLLTKQKLHIREAAGFRILTDIDVFALRPRRAPGPPHHQMGQGVEEGLIVTDVDLVAAEDELRTDEVATHDRPHQVGDLLSLPHGVALEVWKADLASVRLSTKRTISRLSGIISIG